MLERRAGSRRPILLLASTTAWQTGGAEPPIRVRSGIGRLISSKEERLTDGRCYDASTRSRI